MAEKEYIEREAAIESMYEDAEAHPGHIFWTSQNEALHSIPAADVRPVVRGKWKGVHSAECSECGHVFPTFLLFEHYCPSCGAEMERVE